MKVHSKQNSKSFLYLLKVFLCATFILSIISCGMLGGGGSEQEQTPKTDKELLIGSWFFDYGYNQEISADDQMKFNADGTFITQHIEQNWTEYDKGSYKIDSDKKQIELNIKQYKEDVEAAWQDVDVKMVYTYSVDEDELTMNRTLRDTTSIDDCYTYFNPPVYNHFYRMKDVTADFLTGKWPVAGNPEHGFTFNDDETWEMKSDFGEYFKGDYEINKGENGSEMHMIMNRVKHSIDGEYEDISDPPEYFYDAYSAGNNHLLMKQTSAIDKGVTYSDYPDVFEVSYRDMPFVKYTYHWKAGDETYTFYDYWPKGEKYTVLDSSKIFYITNVPDYMTNQEIVGCYTNENLSGTAVTFISAGENTIDRDFWVKWTIKTTQHKGYTNSGIPANILFNNLSFKADDTVCILFEADLSKDINGWSQIKFWAADGMIGCGQTEINTKNKKLYAVYNVETTKDSPANKDDWFQFDFVHSEETGSVILSNWKLTVLDDTNSYKLNYHFGDLIYTERIYKDRNYDLPTDMGYFESFDWNVAHYLLYTGWKDGNGVTITKIAAGNTETKDVYIQNFAPNFHYNEPDEEGGSYSYSIDIPAKLLLTESYLSSITGKSCSVKLKMTAEIDITPKEKSNFWFQLVDWSNDGWEPVLWCGYEEIESATVNDNLITVVFTLRPLEPGKQLPASVNDFGFNFGYNDDFYPELVKFTNLKFEVIE